MGHVGGGVAGRAGPDRGGVELTLTASHRRSSVEKWWMIAIEMAWS